MKKKQTARPDRKRLLAGILVVMLCTLALAKIGRGLFSDKSIPAPLRGTWTTDAPNMTDRYLRLAKGLVVFGLGQDREQIVTVIRIESAESAGGETRFTIHYRDDAGSERTLDFAFQPDSGGTIRLTNRPELWRRSGGEVRV
jgi:hypothetical protein